jgi:hypothetical protein
MLSHRVKNFHKGIDEAKSSKMRASAGLELAKSKRAEMLNKRRACTAPDESAPVPVAADIPTELTLENLSTFVAGEFARVRLPQRWICIWRQSGSSPPTTDRLGAQG